jgi:hypothetical protein
MSNQPPSPPTLCRRERLATDQIVRGDAFLVPSILEALLDGDVEFRRSNEVAGPKDRILTQDDS